MARCARAYLNCGRRVVSVTEIVSLVAKPTPQMTSIGEEASSRQSDVLVDRLDTAVSPLDEELRVEKALDAENNTVLAAKANGNTVTRQSCARRCRLTQ